jgi:DNA helicase-2/ATP-dependent DNA helicase PcrA
MNIYPETPPEPKPESRIFDFFFDRLESSLRKGRGLSLFQADAAWVEAFSDACRRRGLAPFTIHVSAIQNGSASASAWTTGAAPPFAVLVQDVACADFVDLGELIADRLVFPLWFRRIPVCFFSSPGREAYDANPMKGQDLHQDFPRVIRALLAEQVLTLLDRSNYQLTSPALLADPARPPVLFTPVEEKLRAALQAHELAFQPQVRLGRQTVDFLVSVQEGKQVVVECESKAHHEPLKDTEKGKSLTLAGYPVCRFSGAEIEADIEKCVRTIREAVQYRTLPAHKIDDDLDPSQQAAVATLSGPIRVLAPAGSGKTKTLVNRVLFLLNQGVAAEQILALAFNTKAREEMQERLERRGVDGVDVRTFHSFGYEIVRAGAGWSFSSAHRKTARELMKSAIQEHTELPALRNQDPLDAFLAGLRRAKMELPALSTVTVEYGEKIYPLEPIFHSYLKKQLSTNFLDFDDMIYLAVRLLLQNTALRRQYQSRFEFVLVDEFQDLNEAQLLLLQIIGLPENNIFAVGDDDQMIYGFRGADVRHILEFEKRFPVASTHLLNTNYRSSRMIVRHAGWLIGHNTDRLRKDIQPRRDAQPGRFEVAGGASLLEQAAFAGKWLVEHKKQNNLNWRDYAVLYRTNADQFPVAVVLDALGIPHTPAETGLLFQSAVGMDVYAYLQVLLFPQEAKASDFERILKRPNKYFTNQLIARAKDWDSFLALPQLPNLREWERQKLAEFAAQVQSFSQAARSGDSPPSPEDASRSRGDASRSSTGFMQALKKEFGLAEFYREQSRLTDDLDQASDEGLLDVITSLAARYKTPLEFFQFLSKSIGDREARSENQAEGEPKREKTGDNEVFLSTIHRSKGKEFRNVVYFNLSQSGGDTGQTAYIEEERRVAYVGATRAKDDLLITFASTKPSAFLNEIALNPKFRELEGPELGRRFTASELQLERGRVVLKQLEAKKQARIARFRELTKMQSAPRPAWQQWLLDKIQLWRIDRAMKGIEALEQQIKTHSEETIARLEEELQAMEEENKMRSALLANKTRQSPPEYSKETLRDA